MNKLILCLFVTILVYKENYGQVNASNKPPVNILSPDAANLGKFGAYDVNHYTGTPNISIPIYTIKEADIEIPISISYDASGFIPNKNSSQVGQNWNINAGGAITRVVRGVPDDKHDYTPENFWQFTKNDKGYIYGIQHNAPSTYPTQSHVQNLNFISNNAYAFLGYPAVNLNETGVVYEYNPDIFSFSFMGHSGTFVMGNDGLVKVNSDRNYKIDLANIGEVDDLATKLASISSSALMNTQLISSIIITSDDGYKFHFGGALPTLEMSFQYINNGLVNGGGVISGWYLTKVTTPQGNNVFYNYKNYDQDGYTVLKNLGSPGGNWQARKTDFTDERLFLSDYKSEYNLYNSSGGSSGMNLNKSLIKMAYLNSIETNLHTISFNYSPKNENHFTNPNNVYGSFSSSFNSMINSNRRTSKIDRITISDKSGAISPLIHEGEFSVSPILNFDFVYQYYGDATSGSRLYLKELKYNDFKHVFDYTRVSALPHPLTTGVDKWGFYNEQSNSRLVGIVNPAGQDPGEFETNFSMAGQNRLADPTKVDIGMLKSITYPTGGKTEFQFEANRYKKLLKRKVNAPVNSLIPVLETLPQEDFAGGCRIKKIINIPGITTEYKYVKDYQINSNNPSSGLLIDNGVFRMKMERPGTNYYQEELFDDNIKKSSGFSEPHICYSEVVEIKNGGNEGFTKYIYTNPDDQSYLINIACPDNYFLGTSSTRILTYPTILTLENQMKRLAQYSSRASERGKLSKKEIFTQGNLLPSSSTEYKYNTDITRFNEKTVGYETIYTTAYSDVSVGNGFAYFLQSFQIYNYHNNPSQIIEKSIENGQALTSVTNFLYKSNSNSLLTNKINTKSDGSELKTQYFYPEDKIGNPDFPSSSEMLNKNMLATVIEEKSFRNNVPLITKQFLYGDATGNGGFKLFKTKTLNHTIPSAVNNVDVSINYYNDAMVKEFYKKDDYKTAYIWDYKKTLPIAEVKNVSNAGNIAYTSFETDENWTTGGYNQWNYNVTGCVATNPAPTGGKSFDLTSGGNITRTLNPSINYTMTVWFNGINLNVNNSLIPINGETINQWTLKEYTITGLSNITISGTGKIDELRLYPEKALMTTFCYQPLNGIISTADVNNKITHYSYDPSRRLSGIWDKDLNIVKKICYNYAGQIENCPTLPNGQPPIWVATGNTRCQPCPLNNNYFTGLKEREEINTNPNSNYPNATQWVVDPNAILPNGLIRCRGALADWQIISTVCEVDIINNNTGNQIITQKDLNPCSPTGGQITQTTTVNTAACPLLPPPPQPCTTSNCAAPQYKCINGYCIAGTWCVISSVKVKNIWKCSYGYGFPDGTNSGVVQVIESSTPCPSNCMGVVVAKSN